MDYSAITRAMGCHGIRVTDPEKIADALREGLENTDTPTMSSTPASSPKSCCRR